MNDVVCKGGTLYVVGTPLGNLNDLSSRAAGVLMNATRLYAEDTRRARVLLDHLGSSIPVRSLHEHNERARQGEVISCLLAGDSVAIVSDAGTPAVSDPGADLVAGVAAAGFPISPIPGPSALATALSVAGFVASNKSVLFLGFLPQKGKARRIVLGQIEKHFGVVVFYESPRRLKDTLLELAEQGAARPALIARELTKIHEELIRGSVEELALWAGGTVRGEVTVLLGPPVKEEEDLDARDVEINRAIGACREAGLSARDTSVAVAAILGGRKREIYQRINELSSSDT